MVCERTRGLPKGCGASIWCSAVSLGHCSARAKKWSVQQVWEVMTTCVIIYNMIVEEERDDSIYDRVLVAPNPRPASFHPWASQYSRSGNPPRPPWRFGKSHLDSRGKQPRNKPRNQPRLIYIYYIYLSLNYLIFSGLNYVWLFGCTLFVIVLPINLEFCCDIFLLKN
jgi:hypothetical protein